MDAYRKFLGEALLKMPGVQVKETMALPMPY
jgi:hypothetical protein